MQYEGKRPTETRIRNVINELKRKCGKQQVDPDIIRHKLARRHGWSFAEVDEMSMRSVIVELMLTDKELELEMKKKT